MHTLCRLFLLFPQHTFPIIPASFVLLSGELRLQLLLCVQSFQRILHFLFLFFTGGGHRTARMASSNTVLRPRCVKAEHSRYFTAPVTKKKKKYVKWIQTAKAPAPAQSCLDSFRSILNRRWVRMDEFNMRSQNCFLILYLSFTGHSFKRTEEK